MTADELLEMLRVQMPPTGDASMVAGLLVAPDVWARLAAAVPSTDAPAAFSWSVTVNPRLPAGAIVPVDADGKPMLRPVSPT